MNPIMTFKSRIEGKNADVAIYADRVEWSKGGGFTGGRAVAAVATGGLSLATSAGRGSKHKKGTEVIPVKSISSVTTEKDGMVNTKVKVICTGNTIDFRLGHAQAHEVKDLLVSLVTGSFEANRQPPAATPPAPPTAATPPAPDRSSQLRELAQLRDDGILSEEEFAAEKAKILGS